MPDFKYETTFIGKHSLIAGIDEAGRGPWAGPVVAGAVIFPQLKIPEPLAEKLDDSKKLSAAKREELFNDLHTCGALIGCGSASVEEIESINIRNATKLAMKRSYEDLLSKYLISVDCVIVDGNFTPKIDKPAQYVIKGDQKSISIATASIIAKVSRDNLLKIMDKEYPQYNWKNNKGYGTKEHLEAIKKFGLCKYHRKSFIHI